MWHGLAPRYLTFFVNSVFFIQFSSVISRFEGLLPEPTAKSYPWRALKVIPSALILRGRLQASLLHELLAARVLSFCSLASEN